VKMSLGLAVLAAQHAHRNRLVVHGRKNLISSCAAQGRGQQSSCGGKKAGKWTNHELLPKRIYRRNPFIPRVFEKFMPDLRLIFMA
jgi:hypothetical protein